MQKSKFLLACDLDRTVIPDGPHPLSENAFKDFLKLVQQPWIILAYMTGRSLTSTLRVLKDYNYPLPDVINGDCGTSIYRNIDGNFIYHQPWHNLIKRYWDKVKPKDIVNCLRDLMILKLQEESNQNIFKVSYYVDEYVDKKTIKKQVLDRLEPLKIKAEVVITINHIDHFGYIDIIPRLATKGRALLYLQKYFKLSKNRIIFAGDSGNDLEPLTLGFNSIVVKNASDIFKEEVKKEALKKDVTEQIYFAEGGFKKMNGNYISGILEGLHYFGIN